MKKIITIAFVLSICLCLVQCTDKQKNTPKVEVETYEVTPEFAEKIDKPEVHFKVDIPKNLKFTKPEEGKKNSSYGMVQKIGEDEVVTEMYSFGYISLDGMNLEESGISFLKQIRDMLKRGGYSIENDEIGTFEFDGEEYISLRTIGTMKEGMSDEFVGNYLFNIIIKPNPYGNTHIIMLMAARDDQAAKTYDDFKDKLTVSTIWNSFTYLK
ncbi:hypothetical protein C8N46_11297 [Kordia periserrulae]|uniref:Uncharacterized protein n=1 Tax=Kordia periserrulae TaxID=701523 RepID=A0A2T6BRW3_9FLAO|nr:hypothetical protein [Kordia periserrulae]PTX58789.1 hypothetical protein C8N46_11297 [Kordia periserrulae]